MYLYSCVYVLLSIRFPLRSCVCVYGGGGGGGGWGDLVLCPCVSSLFIVVYIHVCFDTHIGCLANSIGSSCLCYKRGEGGFSLSFEDQKKEKGKKMTFM